MSSAAPLQQAIANSQSEARNTPRQLRQNSARSASEKQNSFIDSRLQTAIQRRLRETAADSPQTAQLLALQRMAAASEHANQLKAMKSTASAAALQRVEDEEPLQAKFAAIQRVEEEEPLQGKFNTAQRVEEDEPLQNKLMTAQRVEDEELLQGKFAPVQRVEEDELLQGKFDTVQRVEEDEPLQNKLMTTQRVEDEELLQGKFAPVQRVEEDEPLQGKFNIAQRVEEDEPLQNKLMTAQRVEDEEPLQGKFAPVQRVEEDELLQGKFDTVQRKEQVTSKPNNTGLPNQLKSGIESLSGMSMDHVKVHYNSSQPAQLNALAYAQGSDIHVAPGQEQHLPHEAWHVVQQAQGRVKPTMQMKDGVPVNDDAGLETEADVMGAKALLPGTIEQTNDIGRTDIDKRNSVTSKATNSFATKQFRTMTSLTQPKPNVIQLESTNIKYGNLTKFVFDGVEGAVGTKMSAHLNPAEPIRGSDTNSSNAFSKLFDKLQNKTKPDWVRGHLLHHDLGGVANYNNLFPLTKAANNEHKYEVEYPIKNWLANGYEINYDVTAVKKDNTDTNGDGMFICDAKITNGKPPTSNERIQKTIYSSTDKIDSERMYKDSKKNKKTQGFIGLKYGSENNVMRDTYKGVKETSGWEHTSGTTADNYYLHDGFKFPSSNLNALDDIHEMEDDHQMEWLVFSEKYMVGGLKIDINLVEDIIESAQSETNDGLEYEQFIIAELEENGYSVKSK